MKKYVAAGIVATLALTGTAIAADMPAPVYRKAPPPVAPVYSWTGCYIGVEGGGAWGTSRHTGASLGTTAPILDISNNYDVSGGLFGGTVGCNYQASGQWVFGLEGDMSWANKKGGANDIAPFLTTVVSSTSEHWLATGRARLGYALSNPVLLYVTGGFAVASVEAIATAPAPAPAVSETRTRLGWTIGAGAEWGFAPNWSAKLEYLRVELEKTGYYPVGGVAVPGVTIVHRDDVPLNNNIVRAGINYRF
jgi:outer membrane immunogenic protein